jgi:hypothetical protein
MNKSWMLMIAGALLVADGLATPARAQGNVVYAAEYNQPTNHFGTINLLNGNFVKIASIGSAKINDIAYCPTNGVLYGISNSAVLVTFNMTNGAITKVANLSTNNIESLAFRPSDGKLFGATQSKLYTINPVSGTATSVGSYGSPNNLNSAGQNIRFAQDGNLYVSNTSTNTDIYRLNTTNGSATWMGEAVGYPYLMLMNASSNMYGVFVNLGNGSNSYPELASFNLSSFVTGGTNANGSTHQIALNLVGAGTNFPANVVFSGNVPQPVTNLTVTVSATGPTSQTVCPGDGAVFSTVASGTGPYSYAWWKNGSVLSGQTNSSLTLVNVGAGDAATYSVIVSGAMGTVTNSATLTVNAPVTVTAAPLNQASVAGGSATFSVTASGTGLSYQWLFNGQVIGASTNVILNNLLTSQAGVYTVIVSGTCDSVTNTATLTVNKATASITLGSLNQTYNGSAKAATATTTPSGLAVTFTYNGSATVPTSAGSYTVVGTINDPNYQGSATGTLVIAQASGGIVLGSLNQTYNGSAEAATATTTPSGLAVTFTYNGSATIPTSAGSYTVVGTINDPNYQGSATGTLVIAQASGGIVLGSLNQTYNGSAEAATATTTPSGLAVTFTYNGSATIPTSAGSYTVVGTINDPNYQGSATGTLVIAQASGGIVLGSLNQTYNGSAEAATATTTPSGLAVTFTYNGSTTVPTSAGSYTVVGTINDPNYQGSATGTLVIAPAPLTITAAANTKSYDGTTNAATVPTVTGLQGFDTVTGLTETYDTKNVGTGKTLTVSTYTVNDGNAGANYTVSTVSSSAGEIDPATLTVTANDKSKMCGQPNPALTASYSGFIGGEDTNVLTSPAVLITTATINSTAGTYPITASGAAAANYTVSYDNGTLTVVQAPQLSYACINVSGTNQFVVSWSTITNQTYQLEWTTNLAAPTWAPAGGSLPGTGAMMAVTNSMTATPQCFFRLELQ